MTLNDNEAKEVHWLKRRLEYFERRDEFYFPNLDPKKHPNNFTRLYDEINTPADLIERIKEVYKDKL